MDADDEDAEDADEAVLLPQLPLAADDERRVEDLCVTVGNCKPLKVVFAAVVVAVAPLLPLLLPDAAGVERRLEVDEADSDDELFFMGARVAADEVAPAAFFCWLEIGAMDEDKEHTERVVSLSRLLRLVDFGPQPASSRLDWLAWRDPVADVGRIGLVTLAPIVVLVVCSGFLSGP